MTEHYLDNAATTRVSDAVIDTITDVLRQHYANSSALYTPAARSEEVLENARAVIAAALGCQPQELLFTASGSEGNNIALWGAAFARRGWAKDIVLSGYEHASLLHPGEQLKALGYTVKYVEPDENGLITPERIAEAVGPHTALAAAMQVNNETGALLDVARMAELVKQKNPRTAVHADGVQAFMKFPIDLHRTKLDSYTVVGHKIHAPKGVGALYLRRGYHIEPPYLGGKQEQGLRPGTENVAYIAGFAKAVELLRPTVAARYAHVRELNDYLRQQLAARDGIVLNSPAPEQASPYVLNLSVPGLRSETILHFLELKNNVYVSSGSACGKGAASHTLAAMGLDAARIDSALRVSFCGDSTREDVDAFLTGLDEAMTKLSRAKRPVHGRR